MRRWLKGGSHDPPAPPPRLDITAQMLETFETRGVLQVPSPDGAGTYTFLKNKTNIKGYPVTLYWDGKTHGSTVHEVYGGGHGTHALHPEWGGEVAYWFADPDPSRYYKPLASKDQRAIVATVLQFIQAGKLIYLNNCGAVISVSTGK